MGDVLSVCLIMSVLIISFSLVFLTRNLFHFLSLMLVFELMTMGVFLLLSFCMGSSLNAFGCYTSLVFLVFCVGEAVIGLGLLVSCSRSSASSAVKSFSFMGV